MNSEPQAQELEPGQLAARPNSQSADAGTTRTSAFGALLRTLFSFPVLLGVVLVGAVFVATYNFTLDPDVWWHIKVGESILRTHHWPAVDTYSFTAPGVICIYNQWLGEVLMALAARLGALRGLYVFQIVGASAVLLALYVHATMCSGNCKAGLAGAALVLPFTTAFFSMRPQILAFLFLVITLIALQRFRQGKFRALWLLPLLFLVWVNTHPFFVVGLGAIGVYWASGLVEFRLGGLEARRWRAAERQQLELVLLLSLLAVLITPYGTELAVIPFDLAFKPSLFQTNILEWQPMPFNLLGGKLFLALVVGLLLAQVTLGLTWRLQDLVLVIGGITMACLHVRFLLIAIPFLAPALSTIVARWAPPYNHAQDKYVLNVLLMAFVLGSMVWKFPSQADLEQRVGEQYPVQAVDYLRTHAVPGPMYNSYGYGGYLIGKLGPEHKVFIDGRLGPYERTGVFADYMYITQFKPGALAVLKGYGVQSCLIDRDEPLATLLAVSSEWRKVYQDKMSALFVRALTSDK